MPPLIDVQCIRITLARRKKHRLHLTDGVRNRRNRLASLRQRRAVGAIVGAGLLLTASVLYALDAGGPHVADIPVVAWIAGIGGAWALLAAWPRR